MIRLMGWLLMSEDDRELTICEQYGEHRDYDCQDEESQQYLCHICGAEWWDGDDE